MTVHQAVAPEALISLTVPSSERPELASALRDEAELLESLIQVLERQRQGIADSDLRVVDETVQGSQRILLTLGEARKKRRRLLQLTLGPDASGLSGPDQEQLLGPSARVAWEHLKEVAERLSTVLAVNQSVLQEAIRFGEEYVRAVFGGGVPDGAGYTRDAQPAVEGNGGVLINRKV